MSAEGGVVCGLNNHFYSLTEEKFIFDLCDGVPKRGLECGVCILCLQFGIDEGVGDVLRVYGCTGRDESGE